MGERVCVLGLVIVAKCSSMCRLVGRQGLTCPIEQTRIRVTKVRPDELRHELWGVLINDSFRVAWHARQRHNALLLESVSAFGYRFHHAAPRRLRWWGLASSLRAGWLAQRVGCAREPCVPPARGQPHRPLH